MLVTASVHFKSDGSWPSGDFLNTLQYIDVDRCYSFRNVYQKIIHCPIQTAYKLMEARSVSVHSIDSLVIYRVYQSTNLKFHCEKNKKHKKPNKFTLCDWFFFKPDKFQTDRFGLLQLTASFPQLRDKRYLKTVAKTGNVYIEASSRIKVILYGKAALQMII